MRITNKPRRACAWTLAGLALAAAVSTASAQVSLGTVVDLAQRNSSTVKLAQADVQKAAASLSEAKGAFIPALSFGSGLPAFPEVGFTGQSALHLDRKCPINGLQHASVPIHPGGTRGITSRSTWPKGCA